MTAQNIKDFNIATGVGAPSTAVASLVKAWESKTTQRALRGSSLGLMALSLAACGGSDSTTDAGGGDPVVVPGVTKDFTVAQPEALVGGDGNDTFNGLVINSLDGTLQASDSANGGLGIDTLNIYVDAEHNNGGLPSGVTFTDIEIVKVYQEAGLLDDTNAIDSADFAGVTQIWQIDAEGDIEVGSGVTAGFENINDIGAYIAAKADVTSVSIAGVGLTADDSASQWAYFEVAGADVTTVNVAVDLNDTTETDGTVWLEIDQDDSAIETANFVVSSSDEVGIDVNGLTDLVTIDAHLSTADLLVDVSNIWGADSILSVSTGTGDDTVIVDQDGVSVSLSAGDDTVVVANVTIGATISLGAGADTVDLDAAAVSNLVLDSIGPDTVVHADSLIVITDFNADDDIINLSTGALDSVFLNTAASGETADDILAADSLYDALVFAEDDFSPSTGESFAFVYGNNTYIFVSDDASGVTEGDGLIQLSNFTDLEALNADGVVI